MTDRRLRLSTRFLLLFKVLSYFSLLPALLMFLLGIEQGNWLIVLSVTPWMVLMVPAIIRWIRKLRTVVWEKNQLVVKDQMDIIILPEEIKSIELKMIIGVHEVTLCQPHPYVGDSFLFLASMNYLFSHNQIDDQMYELRRHRRPDEARANAVARLKIVYLRFYRHHFRYSFKCIDNIRVMVVAGSARQGKKFLACAVAIGRLSNFLLPLARLHKQRNRLLPPWGIVAYVQFMVGLLEYF